MRIQIYDVDEVILRFGEAYIDHLNTRLGMSHRFEDVVEYDIHKALGVPEGLHHEIYQDFIKNDLIGSLEPYRDAVDHINSLPDGVAVILVTALEKTPNTVRQRLRNLRGVDCDQLIFTKDRCWISRVLKPEMVFEDNPANVGKYLSEGGRIGRICVPRRPYTRDLEREFSKNERVAFYDLMTELD